MLNMYIFLEFNSRLSKFSIGISLWNKKGFIDMDNPDDIGRVCLILREIDPTPAYDFFGDDFNGLDPDSVCEIIGISAISPSV